MIIDDDPENLRALGAMLTRQGYTVRSFPGGPAALKSARAEPPDIILLDIRLPKMNGFEVCAHLKTNDTLKDIPVIFLTAVDETDGKVQAFGLGAADFITKPFQTEEVLARINTHLTANQYKKELEKTNKFLDARVQERTSDLLETNRSLRKEIAARREAQEALQESEEKYRCIVTTANEAIFTVDETFRIEFANDMALNLLKGTEDQIIGQPGMVFIHEEDRPEMQKRFQDRKKGNRGNYECRIRQQDGGSCWVIVSASPILNSNGCFKGSVVMLTDISGRKQSEMDLKLALDEIAELKKMIEAENIYLQEEIKIEHNYEEIVGNSDEIKYVLFRLEQVAQTDSAVIILGETGTGKELVARAIHNLSNRSLRPLIKVNCATLPDSLIESELFGHVKGAFSGAVRTRQGRFDLAHKGTLFLDEIGDLPLHLQSKLLRVLETGEYEQLGGNQTNKADFRLVAATNRDLKAMVSKEQFREDLWYRLNVYPITVPPLRNRREDIPLLVDHFLKNFNKKMGKPNLLVSKKTMQHFMSYQWPGNVRELKHVIERSVITSQGKKLQLQEKLTGLPDKVSNDLTKTLASVEAEHIYKILDYTQWVIEGPRGAASILQLHPNTLRYRMKKLGIERAN